MQLIQIRKDGSISKAARRRLVDFLVMGLLFCLAFVYLYPMIFMGATSLKTVDDLRDPTVFWVPTTFQWSNVTEALRLLDFWKTAGISAWVALAAAAGQVLSCAVVGYGFARYKFPGRDLLFMLVVLTFLVPPQTMVVSLFALYKKLGWINTYYPILVPGFLAQGLKGALFVIICRQFFKGLPWELEEAARIDGAGVLRILYQIMLPLAVPALLVVFLFSLVWHWNDFFQPMMFLVDKKLYTLPLKLETLRSLATAQTNANILPENILMAACLLVVLPPILLYLFTQRYFVQSLQRTGITGQ